MNEMIEQNIININLNNFRNFYVVANTLNYTKAADVLHISQPAVSYSINKLEEELGCILFEKKGKDICLTNNGEELYRYVISAFKNLNIGLYKIENSDDIIDSVIKIGVPTNIGSFLLAKIIEKFIIEYPGVKFKIISRSTMELVNLLNDKEIDLIIDSYPIITKNTDIKVIDLIEFNTCFFASYKFANLENKILTINEVAKLPLLLPDPKTSTFELLKNHFKDVSFVPKINVSTTEVMRDMVKKGVGIGYCARMGILEDIVNKNVFEIRINDELPKALIQMAYLDNNLNKASYKFMLFTKNEVNKLKVRQKKVLRIIYTQKCPFKCEFCHKEGINREVENKLSNDDLKHFIKLINRTIGTKEIHFTGGEPLAEDSFPHLIKELHTNNNLDICMTTNGYYIDKKIDCFEFVKRVSISMHVLDKAKFEEITKIKDSYEKVTNNIKLLRSKYPFLNISINMTIINGFNSDPIYIKKAIKFTKSIGASLKLIQVFNFKGKVFDINSYIPLLEKENYQLKKETFRKKIYCLGSHEVLLTKCSCDAVKFSTEENACRNNNDLYLTMDGNLDLCRFRDIKIDLYRDIVDKNDEILLNKVEMACDMMGDECLCQKK